MILAVIGGDVLKGAWEDGVHAREQGEKEEELERVHDRRWAEVDHVHDVEQEENVCVEEYDKRVCRRSWRWSSSVCTTRDRSCAQRAGECAEVVPVHFVEEEENVPAEE